MGKISEKAISCIDENATLLYTKDTPPDEDYIRKVVEKSKGINATGKINKGPPKSQKKEISDLLDEYEKEELLEQKKEFKVKDQENNVKKYSLQEKK